MKRKGAILPDVTCPQCGSNRVTPIVFGMSPYEYSVLEERGELILRGCLVGETDPDLHCRMCKHEWADDSIEFEAWIDAMVEKVFAP